MIGWIEGQVIYKDERQAIVLTGGLGYRINLLPETRQKIKIGTPVKIWTYLAVREDALELFGFSDKSELDFFELLISVSGIGPRGAQAILALAPPETLAAAVRASDANYLTRVSGIGRKRAEKIILELKDKLPTTARPDQKDSANLQEEADALDALRALGYSATEARAALAKVTDPQTTGKDKLRAALKILGQ